MLIARNPEKLDDTERQLIARLEKDCPTVALLQPFVRGFAELPRRQVPCKLGVRERLPWAARR
jgi:hypothetical protein